MALEDTFEARREFVRNRRQQQATRRARTAADRAGRVAGATMWADSIASIAEMPVIAMVTDIGMDPAAGITRPGKPRRASEVVPDAIMSTNGAGTSSNDHATHASGASNRAL